MKDEGVDPADIRFVEMPPPDMPGALATKAIDAYFVGEPHAARAELDGSGRVLYHAKDIWPRFISCVLVVTEKLIAERPAVVKDLVRGIAESGEWAETHRADAARLVSPYFRQDEKLVRYVLTQPPDRVSYRMLTPNDDEMQRIADMGLEAGILERRLDVQGPRGPAVHPRRTSPRPTSRCPPPTPNPEDGRLPGSRLSTTRDQAGRPAADPEPPPTAPVGGPGERPGDRVGPGVNFVHYDPGKVAKLYALEPNPGMIRLAGEQRRHTTLDIEFLGLPGERIPLADACIDTVVSTFTLCTIPGVMDAVRGIVRVLKPGGKLIFFEISLSPEPRVRRWQRWWEPVHRSMFEGLYLTRDIPSLLEQGGFQLDHVQTGYVAPFPKSWSHCCWGTGTPRPS